MPTKQLNRSTNAAESVDNEAIRLVTPKTSDAGSRGGVRTPHMLATPSNQLKTAE